MYFLFTIFAIIGFFYLGQRITKLEERINSLTSNYQPSQSNEGQVGSEVYDLSQAVPLSTTNPVPPPNPFIKTASTFAVATEPSAAERFFDWLKEDFLMKLGAFLLLLAFGWLASYAVINEWIGPLGQITIGLLAGAAVMVLGIWRIGTHKHQGGIFTVLGSTIILLTTFAAREIYYLFTPLSALIMMFMTVVFVSFVAVRYNSKNLAGAGLFLGSIAPLFTNSPAPDTVGLFLYLLLVAAGTLWVVWQTGWTKLILASLLITFTYSLFFMLTSSSADTQAVLMFSFIFIALYFGANMVSLLRRHGQGEHHMPVHAAIAIGIAVFLFVWVEAGVSEEWRSLIYSAWAIIFAFGAYVVYIYTANRIAFYIYGATSVALVGVATAAELSGPTLTLAYWFEIAAVLVAAGKLGVSSRSLSYIGLLFAVPALLSVGSLDSRSWRDGIWHNDFVVVIVAIVTLFGFAYLWSMRERSEKNGLSSVIDKVALMVGSFFSVSLVWLVTHALLAYDVATTISLIIYTIVGISLFVIGTARASKGARLSGSVMIGLVVLRLLFIDVWEMSLEGRIVTFLIIGVMLISTAFVRKLHHKETEIN